MMHRAVYGDDVPSSGILFYSEFYLLETNAD